MQHADRLAQLVEQCLRLVVVTALLQHHTILVHLQDAGIVFADQRLNRTHLDEQLGAQLIESDLLINHLLIGVVVGLQDIDTLVDLLHHLVDHLLIGVGRDGELMDSLDSRRRHGECLDIQLPACEDNRDLIQQTYGILRKDNNGI